MLRTKAQSVSEYAIFVAGLLLAVLAIQGYVKRGLQGRYSDVVQHATAQVTASQKNQYEPYYQQENFNNRTGALLRENIQPRGLKNKIIVDVVDRSGQSRENINCYDDR